MFFHVKSNDFGFRWLAKILINVNRVDI